MLCQNHTTGIRTKTVGSPIVAHQVKDTGYVPAAAWIQSLAWELPCATSATKTNKNIKDYDSD